MSDETAFQSEGPVVIVTLGGGPEIAPGSMPTAPFTLVSVVSGALRWYHVTASLPVAEAVCTPGREGIPPTFPFCRPRHPAAFGVPSPEVFMGVAPGGGSPAPGQT